MRRVDLDALLREHDEQRYDGPTDPDSRGASESSSVVNSCAVSGCENRPVQGITVCLKHERIWDASDIPASIPAKREAWQRFLSEVGKKKEESSP